MKFKTKKCKKKQKQQQQKTTTKNNNKKQQQKTTVSTVLKNLIHILMPKSKDSVQNNRTKYQMN